MQDAYPFFIVISALCLLMGLLFLTGSKKSRYFAISAACVISQPVLSVSGMLLKSEKLLVASLFLPISLFLTVSAIEILTRYRKCSFLVSAEYVSFEAFSSYRGRSHYAPCFSYKYKGERYSCHSFLLYSKRKLNKLFELNHTYNIYIAPNAPNFCVDKRSFPVGTVIGLLCWILFFAFGVVVVLLL